MIRVPALRSGEVDYSQDTHVLRDHAAPGKKGPY